MDEQTFKAQFIAGFLSSWCATNHGDYCARGLHQALEDPPVEDAIYLADKAWDTLFQNGLVNLKISNRQEADHALMDDMALALQGALTMMHQYGLIDKDNSTLAMAGEIKGVVGAYKSRKWWP